MADEKYKRETLTKKEMDICLHHVEMTELHKEVTGVCPWCVIISHARNATEKVEKARIDIQANKRAEQASYQRAVKAETRNRKLERVVKMMFEKYRATRNFHRTRRRKKSPTRTLFIE